jgi:hypothetical protein
LKIAAILLSLLLLFGCASAKETITEIPEEIPEIPVPEEPSEPEEPKPSEIKYVAPPAKTPEMAVINYFDALYDSYTAMLPVDISPAIDTDSEMMRNVQNWNSLLAMRRSIISEKGYCFVETERFPFTIDYFPKSELDDQRMDYVRLSDFGEGAAVLHFAVRGLEGKAYPPIFAPNSQHTMILTFEEGIYKIAYHYFPGSEGKFQNDLPVELMAEEEMQKLLEEEFIELAEYSIPSAKYKRVYNADAAIAYALEYCENRNKKFYFVGDWYGNCMNFTSQSIWSGFRKNGETPANTGGMTRDWYCTKGSGTLAWSSVSRFWNWIGKKNCDMQVFRFYDVRSAKKGDIVNIGSYACETPEKYTHALLLVDDEKMIMAQNSPACFVYYSDLANNYARFIRPISLDA